MTQIYKTTVTLPFGNLRHIIDWCRNNLKNEFRFEEVVSIGVNETTIYNVYFETEQDYFTFVIWKK